MSGGRATLGRKAGNNTRSAHAGDIVANREEGMPFLSVFVIECKAYKDFSYEKAFVHGHRTDVEYIVTRPWKEADDFKKLPFVVLKLNKKPPIVATTSDGYDLLSAGAEEPDDLPLLALYPQEDIHIVKFSDVVVNLKYKKVERAIKSKKKSPRLV